MFSGCWVPCRKVPNAVDAAWLPCHVHPWMLSRASRSGLSPTAPEGVGVASSGESGCSSQAPPIAVQRPSSKVGVTLHYTLPRRLTSPFPTCFRARMRGGSRSCMRSAMHSCRGIYGGERRSQGPFNAARGIKATIHMLPSPRGVLSIRSQPSSLGGGAGDRCGRALPCQAAGNPRNRKDDRRCDANLDSGAGHGPAQGRSRSSRDDPRACARSPFPRHRHCARHSADGGRPGTNRSAAAAATRVRAMAACASLTAPERRLQVAFRRGGACFGHAVESDPTVLQK